MTHRRKATAPAATGTIARDPVRAAGPARGPTEPASPGGEKPTRTLGESADQHTALSIKCNTPAGVLATAAADVDRDGGRSVRSTVLPAPWERWLDGCPLRGRDRLLARAILVRAARDARELEGVRRA